MPTMRQIIVNALYKINALSVGEQPSAAEAQDGLTELNLLFDDWNAMRHAVYAQSFDTYTLVPNLLPHTIGPTAATFTVTQRPVSLDGASLILDTSTPASYQEITVRDWQWWHAQPTPTLASTFPTDVYYQPDWPNGKLFFWPTPQTAYDVELVTRVLLAQVALSDDFSLPPGYQHAITLTLAERLAVQFSRPVTPDLGRQAQAARARVFANNDFTPRIATADAGMHGPSGGGQRADFYWLNGSIV
jgi:hypothetical protein